MKRFAGASTVAVAFVAATLLSPCAAAAGTVAVASCEELPSAISGAAVSTLILLPEQTCVIGTTIPVPPGVRIVGRPGSVLVGEFPPDKVFPIFDLAASNDVEMSNFTFRLQDWSAAIRAAGARRVTLSDLRIEGTESLLGTAGVPIFIQNAANVIVERVRITDSFGGVYVLDSRTVTLQNNTLARVNFGNLVVSGSSLRIIGNSIDQPGLPSAFHHASGDGITIDGNSSYVVIQGNAIRNGFCYGIAASTGSSNVDIIGNTIERGKTAGIYLVATAGSTVSSNVLRQNWSYGLILDMPSYTTVAGNQFYGNSAWIAGSSVGRYVNNYFTLAEPLQYLDGSDSDVVER